MKARAQASPTPSQKASRRATILSFASSALINVAFPIWQPSGAYSLV